MKLSNTLLGPRPSSLTSKLGDSYRQFSSNFSSTTLASKNRWIKINFRNFKAKVFKSGTKYLSLAKIKLRLPVALVSSAEPSCVYAIFW